MLISFDEIEKADVKNYLQEGVHTVKIVEADENTTSNGNDRLSLKVQVINEDLTYETFVYQSFIKTQKSLTILLNFLGAIGLYDSASKKTVDFWAKDLVGKVFQVELRKGAVRDNGKQYFEFVPWTCKASNVKPKAEKEIIDKDEIPFR